MTEENKCCNECDEGTGECAFPHYGVEPHAIPVAAAIGVPLPKGTLTFPSNFIPDENTNCGIYTHCVHCDRPDNGDLWETRINERTEEIIAQMGIDMPIGWR